MAFNRILIKRAFLSTFRNRLFTILMFFLVLFSGGTYAAFESASSSFSRSYNSLVNGGALHDLVIKENFRLSSDETVIVNQILRADASLVLLDETNLQNNAVLLSNNIYRISVATSLDYVNYGFNARPTQSIIFTLVNNNWANALASVIAQAAELQSQVTRSITSFQGQAYARDVVALYPNELVAAERQSVAVSVNTKAWKVVNYDASAQVNKLLTYQGTSALTTPRSDESLRAELVALLTTSNNNQAPPVNSYSINTLKGYRVTTTNNQQQVLAVTDASAFEAIISPSHAASANKQVLTREALNDLVNGGWRNYATDTGANSLYEALTLQSFRNALKDYLIEVDATAYFIVGVGITPDFAYPIISNEVPTVDVVNQAIVYVNARGYERIIDSFRTNARENYLALRFTSEVSSERRQAIVNELGLLVQSPGTSLRGITLPFNLPFTPSTKMLTYANDPNDVLTLAYERTAFLEGLSNTLNTVTIVTTTLLAIFVAVIVVMVFNVLISANRKSLATLLVLGYTRGAIAFSTAFISFLIGALPAIIGYAIGWGAQRLFTDAFSAFWTIPTVDTSFSWLSLVITVALPTVFMFILIGVVVWISLWHPLPKMLSDSVWDSSLLVEKVVRIFKVLPIRTKYALALMIRNSMRLLLVSIATTSAAIALLVGMSTIGSGNIAYRETVAVNQYEYKVDLYSPTREGGQYARVSYGLDKSKPGPNNWTYRDAKTNQELSYDVTYASTTPSSQREQGHWHVISVNDASLTLPSTALSAAQGNSVTFSPRDVANYLKNKLQVKNLIDRNIVGINAWDIVRQLMPENQQNAATQNVFDLINSYQSVLHNTQLDISNARDFVTELIARQVPLRNQDFDVTSALFQPYIISYNNVITNADDETYTYLNVAWDLADGERSQRVVGLNEATAMLDVGASNMQALRDYQGTNVPIIVNKYISQTWALQVGTVISGKVLNHLDRNFNNFVSPQQSFEVVGIMNGYNNAPFVTTHERANAVVAMDEGGFNGVFSKHATSALLSSLPLYSPSGFYLATDTIVPGSTWATTLNTLLQNDTLWSANQRAQIANDVTSFLTKYSATPLVPLLNNVDWQEVSRKAFESVSLLSATLINIVQSVSLLISIIFTMIVASLIVRVNRRRIATLWALGYRRFEVMRIFSLQFTLSLGVALAISIPVSFGVLALLRTFIVNFGQILIPFSFAPWAPVVVIAILGAIFLGATLISIYSLSAKHALAAFKED